MLAVGNDELGEVLGPEVPCPKCGELHPAIYGKQQIDGEWVETKTLVAARCATDGGLYLVGINNRRLNRE